MHRYIIVSFLSMYLGAGLFGGLIMKQAIPEMNGLGVAYYAVTWPEHVYCAPVHRGCKPLLARFPVRAQAWFFTFD